VKWKTFNLFSLISSLIQEPPSNMEVFEEEKNLENHREILNEIEKSRVALTSAQDVELANSNQEQALVSSREKSTPEKVSPITTPFL
jgi:hypothetical protein